MPTRIRINFVDHYPSVNGNCSRLPSFHVTRGCPRPGLTVEILTLLTNYLNLTVDAKIEPYHSNFTYMLDAIYQNETDLYAGMFINTTLRAPWFDFTEGLYQVGFSLQGWFVVLSGAITFFMFYVQEAENEKVDKIVETKIFY